MTRRAVLTAIGQDRPGLVEEVSDFVLERGGSIEESRMAHMLDQFAIAMLVAGTAAAIDSIAADVDALAAATGIVARVSPVERLDQPVRRATHRLVAQALDQPGLVHEVADVLRRLDVNIESLETTLESAPITGSPVFAMDIVVAVPDEISVDALEHELARVCDVLNIKWSLIPVELSAGRTVPDVAP